MATFVRRMVGAARLDGNTYEEIEADTRANGHALAVVLLASIGSGIAWTGVGPSHLPAMAALTVTTVVGWVTWALLTYLIGTRLFPEKQTRADPGELLRTLGFAQSPGILRPLALVPGLSTIVTGVIAIWTLATMVVAVRQALDYTSTLRALAVCMTGWALALTLIWVVGVFFATPVS